jgi:hypothetical protein
MSDDKKKKLHKFPKHKQKMARLQPRGRSPML